MEVLDANGVTVTGRTRAKRAPKPAVQKVTYDASNESSAGQLQPIAARVLMKILYSARMCRFDLLRAVGVLATYITRWDATCDRRLHRIVCYINSTLSRRMVGYVGDAPTAVRPHLFADADLAGCVETQRSTPGVLQTIRGARTSFPIAVVSKRQGCVSKSTPEAEIVALDHALRNTGLPSLQVWNRVLAPNSRLVVHEDNDVCIRIVRSGKNQTMRALSRTHGISVAWVHERYLAHDFDLQYTPSAEMAADIFTKSFSNPDLWAAACWLVNVCDAERVPELIQLGNLPPPMSQGGGKRGTWLVRADGSGTWTRMDSKATRCRTVYRSGPAKYEVFLRETFDATSGALLESTPNFAAAKVLDALLPEPAPRAVRTVFHFASTSACIPHDAQREPATSKAEPSAPARDVDVHDWSTDLHPPVLIAGCLVGCWCRKCCAHKLRTSNSRSNAESRPIFGAHTNMAWMKHLGWC